jgi:uncharacterized protein (TIGR03435 family)
MTVRLAGSAILMAGLAFPQRAPVSPAFDVASVRPGQPVAGDAIFCESGRLTVYNFTLKALIQMAWRVRDVEVIGGPAWIDSATFYIAAKGDPAATDEECRVMVQGLLKDRFGLEMHNEMKELPVYAVTVSDGGPKFRESEANVQPNIAAGKGRLDVRKVSMANVARVLSLSLGQSILDKTNLTGRYTFHLEWDTDTEQEWALSTAMQKQLGLRLEMRKEPVSVVIVDHAAKPSEN